MLFPYLECLFSFALYSRFLLIKQNGISPLSLCKGGSSVAALVF